MNKIGIITYHYPHLKTEQVLLNLLHRYHTDQLYIYALPFSPRPERQVIIRHRPDMTTSVGAEAIAKAYGISYVTINNDTEVPSGLDYYLVLGAGILSAEFTRGKKTINCHPGVIPAVRGLDAFKWSIYENKPLGVSMHFIDEFVDAGEIISILPTSVYTNDTFETLCRRHYELEIYITTHFEHYLNHPTNIFDGIPTGEPHRRMGHATEQQMVEKFEEYKQYMAGRKEFF